MLKCQKCGREYPSKYYFVDPTTCNDCFSALDAPSQDKILTGAAAHMHDGSSIRSVDGHALTCPICKHDKFWARKTLMNTPGMTFWGIEWANREAENFVCDSCGYVMWFLR